jgi:hypothetical protein
MGEAARPKSTGTELFSYHGQLSPMLWLFAVIAFIEVAIVHLLVAQWSRAAAIVFDGAGGAAFVAIIALLLSLRRRPVELNSSSLKVRTGLLLQAEVPLGEIAFAQSGFAPADYMPGSLLKASLLSPPNVLVLLRRDVDLPGPLGRRRRVHAVALALDEPARFLLALNTRIKSGAGEPLAAA